MKKIMVASMAISLFVSGTMLPINATEDKSPSIVESESNKVFDGDSVRAIQNGDNIEMIDKKTGEKYLF